MSKESEFGRPPQEMEAESQKEETTAAELKEVSPKEAVEQLRQDPTGEERSWRDKLFRNPTVRKLVFVRKLVLVGAGLGGMFGAYEAGKHFATPEAPKIEFKTVPPKVEAKTPPLPKQEAPKPAVEKKEVKYNLESLRKIMELTSQKLNRLEHMYQRKLYQYDNKAYNEVYNDARGPVFEILHAAHRILSNPDSTDTEVGAATEIAKIMHDNDIVLIRNPENPNKGWCSLREVSESSAEHEKWHKDSEGQKFRDGVKKNVAMVNDGIAKKDKNEFQKGGFIFLPGENLAAVTKLLADWKTDFGKAK